MWCVCDIIFRYFVVSFSLQQSMKRSSKIPFIFFLSDSVKIMFRWFSASVFVCVCVWVESIFFILFSDDDQMRSSWTISFISTYTVELKNKRHRHINTHNEQQHEEKKINYKLDAHPSWNRTCQMMPLQQPNYYKRNKCRLITRNGGYECEHMWMVRCRYLICICVFILTLNR